MQIISPNNTVQHTTGRKGQSFDANQCSECIQGNSRQRQTCILKTMKSCASAPPTAPPRRAAPPLAAAPAAPLAPVSHERAYPVAPRPVAPRLMAKLVASARSVVREHAEACSRSKRRAAIRADSLPFPNAFLKRYLGKKLGP